MFGSSGILAQIVWSLFLPPVSSGYSHFRLPSGPLDSLFGSSGKIWSLFSPSGFFWFCLRLAPLLSGILGLTIVCNLLSLFWIQPRTAKQVPPPTLPLAGTPALIRELLPRELPAVISSAGKPEKPEKPYPETSSYTLELSPSANVHNTFPVSQLRKFVPNASDTFPSRDCSNPDPVLIEGNWEHVERIIDEHTRGRGRQYLVRWKGLSSAHAEWIPRRLLVDNTALDDWKRLRSLVQTSFKN